MKACRLKKPGSGKDIGMRTRSTSCNTPNRAEPAFVGAESGISEPRSTHLPNPPTRRGRHRSLVWSTHLPPTPRNEVAELLADIDGVPVLVRFLVEDGPEDQSDFVSLHSLLSSTLEKVVDRVRGSSLRSDDPSKRPLATVELISSAEHLARLPVLSNDTVLRVGSLELERSDKHLTRASLLKDVWHYKFVPETNLVDVHMGRLRRKVDGSNEPPLIRNVRGVGFVLSATPFSQCSAPRPGERAAARPSDNSSRSVETTLQW